jgi:hypothetical protein
MPGSGGSSSTLMWSFSSSCLLLLLVLLVLAGDAGGWRCRWQGWPPAIAPGAKPSLNSGQCITMMKLRRQVRLQNFGHKPTHHRIPRHAGTGRQAGWPRCASSAGPESLSSRCCATSRWGSAALKQAQAGRGKHTFLLLWGRVCRCG